MKNQFLRLPDGMTKRTRNALLVTLAYLVASVIAGSYLFFQTVQSPSWQLWTASLSLLVMIISSVLALVFIWRGRIELGVWLMMVVSYVAAIGIVSAISGVGALLLVSSAFLSYMVAIQTLHSRQALMMITGVTVGIVIFFLDLFLTTKRISIPGFQSLLYVFLPIVFALFGYMIFRQFRDYSLLVKLVVVTVSIGLTAVAAQAFITGRGISAIVQNQEDVALLGAASQTALILDDFISTNLETISAEAQIADFNKYLSTPVNQRDERLNQETLDTLNALSAKDVRHNTSYGLLDVQGVDVLDSVSSDIGQNKSDRVYFQQAMQTGKAYISPVEISPTTGETSLYFSNPVRNADGRIVGILRVRYNASVLQDLVAGTNGTIDPNSFAVLLDENHIRLAHGISPKLNFKSVMPLDLAKVAELQKADRLPNLPTDQLSTNLPDFEQGLANVGTETHFTTQLAATGELINSGSVVSMKTQPWLVAYFEPASVYTAPAEAQARTSVVFAVIISILIAFVSGGFAQFISAPIVRLTAVADQVAAGNLNLQAKIESADETGKLANAFNLMTKQLRDLINSLESRVAERTHSLELAAEVGRSVSQVRALDIMLTDAAELIRKQFDLYYVQVYLTNPSQTALLLQAGTGAVGRELLGRAHKLPLNTASINGRAAVEKHSVVIIDTATSATFKPNPLLPDTRSEMAVPLLIGEKVVGVLDLQSRQVGELNQDILTAFEALAGQLAIAIQNANFLAETVQARAEVESHARRLTRTNWVDYLDAIHKPEETGFVFEQNKIAPMTQAEQSQPQINVNALTASIEVTGEALGNLVVEMEGQSPISRTSELVNTVARQVAQQIENLRLLDSAERYRAEAEEASRRLTREGWKDYMEVNANEGMSYIYDLKEVRPSNRDEGQQAEKSGFSLPLNVRDETIGRLVIQGLKSNDGESVNFASAVAERLGAHIESLRQFEETQRGQIELDKRARQLASVAEVSSVSSRELDIEKMLASVVRLTQRQFGLYHAHVFTYNENTSALHIAACGWKEGDEHEGTHGATAIPLAQEQSLVARAARTRQNVIANDVRVEAGWLPNPLLPDTISEMAVPLIIGDQILGVLDVQSDRINAFSEEDANIYATLASQVSTALQNARSFARSQQQAERESALNIISQKIQSATTVEAVLQIAARELGHALGAPMTIAQLSMKDKK